jgi:hypothetical protein
MPCQDAGRLHEVTQCLSALVEEPHASVLHAMIQCMRFPGAIDLLGADAMAALEEPLFMSLFDIHRVRS